jgi:hypothetical protein
MDSRVLLFSHPLCPKGTALTPDEINARCRQIKREVMTLAPTIRRLKSSRLEYAVADRDGVLNVEFYLVSLSQTRLPFKVGRRPQFDSDFLAVDAERRVIIDSLAGTATQISLIALGATSFALATGKPDSAEKRLRKLMKRYRGKLYPLHHLGENYELQFPDVPAEVISPAVSKLSCRIHSVMPQGAEIICLSLESGEDSNFVISRSKRYWLNYPPGKGNVDTAIDHLKAAFARQILWIDVHLVREPLTDQVVRFQITSTGSHRFSSSVSSCTETHPTCLARIGPLGT